eukprot:5832459-Lingulodinium_polyedra.AAC.1
MVKLRGNWRPAFHARRSCAERFLRSGRRVWQSMGFSNFKHRLDRRVGVRWAVLSVLCPGSLGRA